MSHLNLGIESLTVNNAEEVFNRDLEILKAMDALYNLTDEEHRAALDAFAASLSGASIESLSAHDGAIIGLSIEDRIGQISNEGFFKNAWSGIKYRFSDIEAKTKKLKKALAKMRECDEETFKTKKIGTKIVSYSQLTKTMNKMQSLFDKISNINVAKEMQVTSKDKDEMEDRMHAVSQDLTNKFDTFFDDLLALRNDMNLTREADHTASDYGYTKANTVKLLDEAMHSQIQLGTKIDTRAWTTYQQQLEAWLKRFGHLWGHTRRVELMYEQVYRAMYRSLIACARCWWEVDKCLFKLADAL